MVGKIETRAMARTRTTRRARGARAAGGVPDITDAGRMLLRPEVVGTVLVVLAAAAVPSVIPLTGVIGGLVRKRIFLRRADVNITGAFGKGKEFIYPA